MCLGGTLLEICAAQGKVDQLRRWASGIGVDAVEVSNGLQAITTDRKTELIGALSADFTVYAETGAKDGAVPVVTEDWLTELEGDLAAGASWVIAEGRESGTVGLYRPDGGVRAELVDAIAARLPVDRVIFETPRKAQQTWFVRTFGPGANLGNVAAGRGAGAGDAAVGVARGHRAGPAGCPVIADPAPNTVTRPYRGLSVQEVDVALTEQALTVHLLGREVYRRTDYLVLRRGADAALVSVRKASTGPLLSPVVEVRVLALPDCLVWVDAADVDVGNATALARTALAHARPGVRAYVVKGRYEHVNFIWEPTPVRVRVTEVVPPHPPKLLAMAEQVVALDEDLPPIDLVLDAVDIRELAAAHPARRYLLPCRGSGVDLPGEVAFLDTRPALREDWTLIGCERSMQFHRHFYGDEPPQVDLCPRERPHSGLTLTKCCLLERGIEVRDGCAVVPWGVQPRRDPPGAADPHRRRRARGRHRRIKERSWPT